MTQRIHIFTYATALALLATPIAAQTHQCTFTAECFEAESCSDTAFNLSIEAQSGRVSLVSDAETVPVTSSGNDDFRIYAGGNENAYHLLSLGSDGTARYSTHINGGPLMVNYLGTCEGSN
ncbi:MAG: hypothetical protein ABJN34_00495 [Litoreibacter sp.]|uniref:hypothetical protein n=1 Tax=Litoreibacter sp. TaxID=1969459 RepID=UPI003298A72F